MFFMTIISKGGMCYCIQILFSISGQAYVHNKQKIKCHIQIRISLGSVGGENLVLMLKSSCFPPNDAQEFLKYDKKQKLAN